MEKKYLEYDKIRCFLVILVIIGHCGYFSIVSNYGGINYVPESTSFFAKNIIDYIVYIIYSFHMPLFFMLSGALFANSDGYTSFSILIKKKFKRLIIPYIIVSLFYVIPIKYVAGYFVNCKNLASCIICGQLLLRGNTHMWFLPILFLCFLGSYLLKKIHINEYYKALFVFILFLISSRISLPIIHLFCKNLIYFYSGYLFHKNIVRSGKQIIKQNMWIKIIAFIVIYICIQTLFFDLRNTSMSPIYIDLMDYINVILVILLGIVLYYCFKFFSKKSKFVDKINEYSFGLYLYSDPIHYLILNILFEIFGLNYFYSNFNYLFTVAIRFIITFSLSYLITYFLKKCKVKYIC